MAKSLIHQGTGTKFLNLRLVKEKSLRVSHVFVHHQHITNLITM